MTLSTLRTLLALTTDETIIAELNAEIAKAEKAAAIKASKATEKLAEYADAHDVVMATLGDTSTPVTLAELWESCADAMPEGFTKSKLSYALSRLWVDEVVKTTGKVNAYSVKA